MLTDGEKARIKKIKGMISSGLKDEHQQSVDLLFIDLEKDPLLKDRTGVEKILDLIRDATNGKVSWNIKNKRVYSRGSSSAGDTDVTRSSRVREEAIGFSIHILDPQALEIYFDLIFEKNNTKRDDSDKSSNHREEIRLKTYGLTVRGNLLIKNKVTKKALNPTDEKLIYFLYFEYLKNKEECFSIKILAQELAKSETYIKNRIKHIHEAMAKLVSPNTPMKVLFIMNKPGRGYHLNYQVVR